MIDLRALPTKFKQIAVLGLGVSGQAVVKALQHHKIDFIAWDDKPETREAFAAQGVRLANPVDICSTGDLVIRSVGMPPHHPAIAVLDDKSVTLWNDLDLLYFAAPQARYIGVTGTNGKSTTTSLIGHILRENNIPVAVGGNLGMAAASLPVLGQDGFYVLELSSYQLATAKLWRCDIAVLLNITEDHLDWHGTMEDYIAAKALIFRLRDHHKQYAVIGIDTPATHALYATLVQSPNHMIVAATQTGADGARLSLKDGVFTAPDGVTGVWPEHDVLKGHHNDENRLIAASACRMAGLSRDQVFAAMATFTGLKHRQQPVATINNVLFINDSKGTNVDATGKALATFQNIYWIVGGKDTAEGLDGLEKFYSHINKVYLIGYATERFAAKLDGQLNFTRCNTIANAVHAAFQDAAENGGEAVVLLSPACKSFDQYDNFEQRGDDFIEQVNQLVEENTA